MAEPRICPHCGKTYWSANTKDVMPCPYCVAELPPLELNAIRLEISGIKCDNPECDYKDETAKFEDWPLWLNKPCPKCGANLLTEEDMTTIRFLMGLVDFANQHMKPAKESKTVRIPIEMNGTGIARFKWRECL